MNKITVFIIRLLLGLVGGWVLVRFFFQGYGWGMVLILAAIIIASAYASEMWRRRKD